MQGKWLYLMILLLSGSIINAQNEDPKKGTIKIRKAYQQEYFITIDSMLTFTKGDITEVISNQIRYSRDIITELNQRDAIVWLRCIVDTSGNVSFCEIKKGIGPNTNQEALKIVTKLSGFVPLTINNKRYDTQFDIPVKFYTP